jgi:hypothetical protein
MLFQSIKGIYGKSFLVKSLVVPLLLFWFGAFVVFAQTTTNEQNGSSSQTMNEGAQAVLMPVIQDYRGIKIGMTAAEVKDKLGKPKVEDETGLFFALSDDESVQIALDTDKTVRVISVMYSKDEKAPKFEDVFGKEVKITAQPDGSVYNLMQYPEAGYWVVYSRTAGDDAMVIVTMQEMPQTGSAKNAAGSVKN